ncbi:hypothetical protein N9X03_04410, partial [Planktomarina temperata]|nr:hypothetical protein [Planktomarina temperata]
MTQEFSAEIIEQLKFYVYRLVDPRNGETFYVGKGVGNRVFQHAQGILGSDRFSEKIERIRDIQIAGLKVIHIIHRHGLDEDTAYEVEAALIDAYPGITNIMEGHGNSEFGVMHASEIIQKYSAEDVLFQHTALMINVNRTAIADTLYEATRFAWRLSVHKAQKAEVVLSVRHGIIIGVFVAENWLPATRENFPLREPV